MQDLNDFYFFWAVVTHGGFSPASRALRTPKSKLSKHVARLEERLGVRLLERSTRRFRVTTVGEEFFGECAAMLAGAEAAEAVVARARAEPSGAVRISCPIGITRLMALDILPGFLAAYPEVRVQMAVLNRRVDLIEERIDVAFRVRQTLDDDQSLTMRTLGQSYGVLAVSPEFRQALGPGFAIEDLADQPILTMSENIGPYTWQLVGPEGRTFEVSQPPRLGCSDFDVLVEAAAAGLGVALMPEHGCGQAIRSGRLVRLLPEWQTLGGIVHMVFTSRRGLLPAVRAFLDHMATAYPIAVERCRKAA